MCEALFLLLMALATSNQEPKAPLPQKADEWLARSIKTLTASKTAQWDATFEVLEAPPAAEQGRKYPFHVGTTAYQFRVKGDNRLHWLEKWQGKGEVPMREAWYEGNIMYLRSTNAPKRLLPVEVGEGEGFCVKRSLVEGGILGWRLAHHFDDVTAGGGFVAAMDVQWVREEKIKNRMVVVLDVKFGFGFGPIRARKEAGTARIWIDKESLLPMKRETKLNIGTQDAPKQMQVNEVYSNWKLNEPLANDIFHTEGMGPPHPLVDAPSGPAAFEIAQTQKFLGFAVRDFPHPQGTKKFDELPADAAEFSFHVTPRKVTGPEPRVSYETKKSVFAKAPDGSTIEALCGYDDRKEIAAGHGFKSTPENRRHQYGGGAYHPFDVYIGKRMDGLLNAKLFFRDVGSHNTAPHQLAMDGKGRCHLTIADVDLGQMNRFKLYWLIGDLTTGKWNEAWLIDHRDRFTSWAHPWSAAWREHVHLIWDWADVSSGDKHKETGIYHVEWTPAGFSRKTRVFKGRAESLDMTVDPDSGRLVVVFSSEEGVFVSSKPVEGPWTRPTRLHPDLMKEHTVSIQAEKDGAFAIRTHFLKTKEWLLKIGPAPKDKAPTKELVRGDRNGDPLPAGALVRLGSLRLQQEGSGRCVAFSPDGKTLATAGSFGEIVLWELPSTKEIHKLSGHTRSINSLAFSPDGKRLASCGDDKTVRIFDVKTGKQIWRLEGHLDKVASVAYSPDGKNVASASWDKTIRIWDMATGKQLRRLATNDEAFVALAYSPTDQILASGSWERSAICLWDLEREDKPRRLQGHDGGVLHLAFSKDGKILASGGWDGMIQISDPKKGVAIRRFGQGLIGPSVERRLTVRAMALSSDGKFLVSGTTNLPGEEQPTIVLWDVETGKTIRRFGPSAEVDFLAIAPDGKTLATAGWHSGVELWNLTTGEPIYPVEGHRRGLAAVAYSPNGKLLATASDDKTAILWEADTGKRIHTLPHEDRLTSVSFSPDGKTLAVGCWDNSVSLWNVATGQKQKQLRKKGDGIYTVAFSSDGKTLASAGEDGTLSLWDVESGKERRTIKAHKHRIYSIAFATEGHELVSCSMDGLVRLWDSKTGQEVRQFVDPKQTEGSYLPWVTNVAISSDGKTVAAAFYRQKVIRIWDTATGKERTRIVGAERGITALAFSADGKILAAAGESGCEVRLLQIATGKEIDRLDAHLGTVHGLAFSRDGTRLATASADHTALIWELACGSPCSERCESRCRGLP